MTMLTFLLLVVAALHGIAGMHLNVSAGPWWRSAIAGFSYLALLSSLTYLGQTFRSKWCIGTGGGYIYEDDSERGGACITDGGIACNVYKLSPYRSWFAQQYPSGKCGIGRTVAEACADLDAQVEPKP